jgi:hypothetical protein
MPPRCLAPARRFVPEVMMGLAQSPTAAHAAERASKEEAAAKTVAAELPSPPSGSASTFGRVNRRAHRHWHVSSWHESPRGLS